MIALNPEKGLLLIAEPSIIGDVSFNRSVVLIANHSEKGSVGFIMNKPLKFKLNELIPEITKDFEVFNGGPVEQDNLYFIHRVPDIITNSIEISHGIYWGGDFDSAVLGIQSGRVNASDIRFFLGYSGWDADQLESELSSNSWVIIENSYKSTIIEKRCKDLWKEKMIEFGGEYQIWSNAPENPSYN